MARVDEAPSEGLTGRLARFVSEIQGDDIPDHVRHLGIRCLINIIGNALGGAQDFAIQRLASTIRRLSGPPQAIVIGRSEVLDRPSAAFLNAASSNVLDFDDTHFPSVGHPSCTVFAPLLSLSQNGKVRGQDFLTAFILGIELACRLGNAVHPDHYRRGGHVTTTCGVIAAAAASGRLLGLSPTRLVWAMGIAATRAGGLVENLGSAAKSVGVGAAARDGLLAAAFAQAGIDSSPVAMEGPRGFLAVSSDAPDPDQLTRGLGDVWEIEKNALKAYPSGVVLGPIIDAAIELSSRVAIGQIAEITVTGNPLLIDRADRPTVETGREAKLSIQHSVACALQAGSIGIADYTDQAVARHETRRLRAKVQARPSDDFEVDAARIEIRTDDGQVLVSQIDHARGSLDRPLSDDELCDKFIGLARWGSPGVKIDRLLQTLWTVDKLDDMKAVTRLCVPV